LSSLLVNQLAARGFSSTQPTPPQPNPTQPTRPPHPHPQLFRMKFLLKEAESQLAVARSGVVSNSAADAAAAAQLRDAQKAAAR
jgi:hypothetical protein